MRGRFGRPFAACSLVLVLVASCLSAAASHSWPRGTRSQGAPQAPPLTIDIVALDRNGRFVDDLRPEEISVTVNGQPRRVISARYVSRGPGAAAAASVRAASGGPFSAASEESRTILVVIDEVLLLRTNKRAMLEAAAAFVDRMGLQDRIAIARIPQVRSALDFTADRPTLGDMLRAGMGGVEALPANGVAQGTPNPYIRSDRTNLEMVFGDLHDLLKALRAVPGRKVVALFSCGLTAGWSGLNAALRPTEATAGRPIAIANFDDVQREAVAARATIYGFGVRQPDVRQPVYTPDLSPVEIMAARTGGQYVMIDVAKWQSTQQASKSITAAAKSAERMLAALSACYVLTLDGDAASPDGRAPALEVKTSRKDVALSAPAWLAATADPRDRPAAAILPEAPQGGAAPSKGPADPELQMVLARLANYVDAYQHQFAAMVAEELYEQSSSMDAKRVMLRSDLLLLPPDAFDERAVREAAAHEWTQFRDVYEVDGHKVRDREDRLKRLFLENSADGISRMNEIRQESARYNVGMIQRNQNVPFYALSFARPENLSHFAFKIAKKETKDGMTRWRVEYKESYRPTFIKNLRNEDVPINGSFLVDYATGAVIETEMIAQDPDMRGRVLVSYRRDPSLGLWLPTQMVENYEAQQQISSRAVTAPTLRIETRASYSKFRRFRVTTEEKLKIK